MLKTHHLYSLNYMNWGAPKMWYGVPGKDAVNLDAVTRKHLPDLFEEHPDLLHNQVCKIFPRHCYKKKLEGGQASTQKSGCIQPEPEQSNRQVVEHKQYKGTKRANEFGIKFDENLTTVDARVLLPPNIFLLPLVQ